MSEIWTSEAPKVDGFYWWRISPEHEPEVVQLKDGVMLATGTVAKFPITHFFSQRWGPMVPDANQLNAMVLRHWERDRRNRNTHDSRCRVG